MKLLFTFILSLGALAQNEPAPKDDPTPRRLESVRWDLAAHRLIAVVSTGRVDGKKYTPMTLRDYVIDLDEGKVQVGDDKREISQGGAAVVHELVDLLVRWSAGTVEWWDEGEKRVTGSGSEHPPGQIDFYDQPVRAGSVKTGGNGWVRVLDYCESQMGSTSGCAGGMVYDGCHWHCKPLNYP